MTSDRYPGDAAYGAILHSIFEGVARDAISMAALDEGACLSRSDFARLLVERHNTGTYPGQDLTCAEYLGCDLCVNDVIRALQNPEGYADGQGWEVWSGDHVGAWFSPDQEFEDNARWKDSKKMMLDVPTIAPDRDSTSALVDHQDVEFLTPDGRIKRIGWDRSHPDVPCLWGWDPKDAGPAGGAVGTHLGLPFAVGDLDAIIWITPQEAFLECVRPAPDAAPRTNRRRRTSAGLSGFGQWVVTCSTPQR